MEPTKQEEDIYENCANADHEYLSKYEEFLQISKINNNLDNSNEKKISDTRKYIATIPPELLVAIIRHKKKHQRYEIINNKYLKKLQPKICKHLIRSNPKVYQSDERRTMNDMLVHGEDQSPSKEKELNGDVFNTLCLSNNIKYPDYLLNKDVIENMTFKSHRDAILFHPAQVGVVIPNINVNVASTSRSVTGQSDQTTKIHYEDPDKDSNLSELEHFLLYLNSLSPPLSKETKSEASTSQANTGQAYQATKELSIDPRILHPVEPFKLIYSESGHSESKHSESGISESGFSESEIPESEHYNIEQELVEDDTESGTTPSKNTADPPTLREDSTLSNGTTYYQATKELSIDPRILHPVERFKLIDNESGHSESKLSESGISESGFSESEISESELYNIEQELVEDDTESGTAPSNNTTDPPTLREDSNASNGNGTSESPPQPNDSQNNGRKLRNSRPLPIEADSYELHKFSKNAMLIINQEDIEGFDELRIGTEDDVNALMKTFGNYGFEVEEYKDKTVADIYSILTEFSKKDFTDYGCIAIAILTHGGRYGLLRAKNAIETYSEHTVLHYLNVSKNPTLLTKPIILIIQACRGVDEATGYRTNTDLDVSKDHDSPSEHYYLPIHSDTLVLHSSFYGKPAFRPEKGSWFIQTLCEKINLLSPKLDLASIITEVQKHVAIKKSFVDLSYKTKEMEINKQMPVMTSTLIRKLYLMRGDHEKWQRPLQTYDTLDAACRNAVEHYGRMHSKVHCSCFIGHFNYLKNCLSHYIDENPTDENDSHARNLLEQANEIDENYDRYKAHITSIAISYFLQNNSRQNNYHKYLYFYPSNMNNHSGRNRSIWRTLCQNYVPMVAACIISSLLFKMINKTIS